MTTRTITGTIRKPDGTAWASSQVRFDLMTGYATATDAAVAQKVVIATTDANGDFSATLEVPATNAWQWKCRLPDNNFFLFNLGAGSSVTLHALMADANLEDTVTPSALADAIAEKADKVTPAASNNIAVLDSDGNLADGGSTIADISGAEDAYNTLSDGATTASVAASKKHETANTGATSFTGFTNHSDGDRLFLLVADANTTLVHNASSFYLSGRQNVTPDSGTLLMFVSDGTIVREIGRRVFDLADTSDITWSVNGNDYEASLSNTGVSAASYTNASITVDAKGRVRAASNGSGFDNEVPLAIDLDTPNTDDVVATFTADGSTTNKILRLLRGATEVLAFGARGLLARNVSFNYSDVLNTTQNSDQYELVMNAASVSNGFINALQELAIRINTAFSNNRIFYHARIRAYISNNSSATSGGTSELVAGIVTGENNSASQTFPIITGLVLNAGQSRSGGTTTTAQPLVAQVVSTGTVTNAKTATLKAPTSAGNVGTSTGLTIEAHDVVLSLGAGDIIIDYASLPTSDPAVAGQLYRDGSNVLYVSAG